MILLQFLEPADIFELQLDPPSIDVHINPPSTAAASLLPSAEQQIEFQF